MPSILTYHPFKAIYTLCAVALEIARFPVWFLLYLPASGRPNKQWTQQQAIRVKLVKAILSISSAVEAKTPHDLSPGKEKDRFTNFDAAPSSVYQGPLDDKEIKPINLGGTWTPKPLTPAEDKSNVDVVLHFHGGAYVVGDGRDQDAGFLAKTLVKHARVTHVFLPNYRLSSSLQGRFPTALQDAVSSYYYLTKTLDIPADRITISGDSAGGNLAIALLRYITEYGEQVGLAPAGCAWLWSPWVDVEAARDPKNITESPQYATDYLPPGFGAWGARTFAPIGTASASSPYVNPIRDPFKSKTPIFVQTGRGEVLYDDNVEIAKKFKEIDGNKVELLVSENCPHDVILVGPLVGFVKEAQDAAKKAGEFLRTERAKL